MDFLAALYKGILSPRRAAVCALLLPSLTLASPVRAEDDDQFEITTGSKLLVGPTYNGSSQSEEIWRPIIEVWWNDTFFLSSERGVGFEVAPLPYETRLTAGFSIGPSFDDRDTEESEFLTGLRSIPNGIELRTNLAWQVGETGIALSSAKEISKRGHGGWLIELAGSQVFTPVERTELVLGAHAIWGSRRYARSLYSISEDEARTSSLPAYDLGSGIERLGGTIELTIEPKDGLLVSFEWESSFLLGDVSRSPLVQTSNQHEFGITALFKY